MKQAAFAALHGVSRKTVTMWKQRGWLVFQGKEVDVAASNALIKRYRRDGIEAVNQSDKPGNKPNAAAALPGEQLESAVERILLSSGANMNIDEARRVKENYLALLNQLEYDQKAGAVVLVAEVAKAVGEEYSKVRTRLLAIPAEQAPRLHRYKTVNELQDALQEIITDALEELTRDGGA